jgi:hypothetical protein
MKIVIYEAAGDWAAALRREVSPQIGIVETRTTDEIFRELTQSPTSIAAVEVAKGRAEIAIATIAKINRQFSHAIVVAVAARGMIGLEVLLREAGAMHAIFSTRQAREIAAIAQKHLASMDQNDFNAEEGNFDQQIAARLPLGP